MKRIHLILLFLPILWFCALSAMEICSKLGVGFNVNTQKLRGDMRSGRFVYGGSPLVLRYNFKPTLFLDTDIGFGRLSTRKNGALLETSMINIGGKLGYRFLNTKRFNPLFYVGLGTFNFKLNNSPRFWDIYGAVGAGAEIFVTRSLGVNLTGDFRYSSGDDFDGSRLAKGKDGYFNLAFGINYYLGGKPKSAIPWESERISDDHLAAEDVVAEQFNTGPDLTLLTFQRDELLETVGKKERLIRLLRVKVESFDSRIARLEDAFYSNGADGKKHYNGRNMQANDPYFMQFQDGLTFYDAGQFERAVEIFKSLVKLDSQNSQAGNWWYWLGESYFGAEDYFSATLAFETALYQDNKNPKQHLIQLMLGVSHWNSGDLKTAKEVFEKLLSNNPYSQTEMLIQDYLAELEVYETIHQ